MIGWTGFALGAFMLAGGTAQFLQLAWGLWVSELLVFAGLAVLGWQLLRFAPLRAMGLDPFAPRSFGLGLAFGLVNYVAWAVPLMALAQAIFPRSMVERFDSAQIFERHSTIELALVLLGVSLAAPIGEELFFRGFLQRGVQEHRGAPRAIVVTAIIFSAFHLDPVGFAARFELGVLFGLLAWRAGSLWPAIAAHAANNALSSGLFLAAGETKEADLVWWVPLTLFIVGNVALLALVRFASGRLESPRPMSLEPMAAAPPGRLFAPWLLALATAVALLLAVDLRGVQLNVLDAQLRPSKELRKQDAVKELRAKARRGDASLEDYEALVRSLK